MTRRAHLLTVLAVVALPLLPAPEAAAEEPGVQERATRTIRRPTVITRPGVYTVAREFTGPEAGAAIVIAASDVTLDLAGRTLTGAGGLGTTGVRVIGARNVRVHGGGLAGFQIGIEVADASNVRIEKVQVAGNDLGGTPPDVEIGIMIVDSRAVTVSHNVVSDTFLGIFVRGEGSGGNRIAENTLVGGDNGGLGICYNPAPGASAGGPHGDLVYGNLVSRFDGGIALSADSTGNFIRGNSLATFGDAIQEATPGSNVLEGNLTTSL